MAWSPTIRRVLLVILAATLVVISVAALLTWHTARTSIDGSAAHQHAALAKHHQAFLEDQHFAATLPIFARRAGNRDAGPVLGPRVRWVVANPEVLERFRRSLPASDRGLLLDPTLPQKLEKDWLDADPVLWAGVDFTWMSRLGEFDFWDLDRNSPEPELRGIAQGPNPSVLEVAAWGKLRLAKGIQEGRPETAIGEVEDLARLVATTEETISVPVSLGLLSCADKARERVAASASAAKDVGKPFGCEARRRVQRAAWGALAHAELRTPSAYDADWDQIAVGRCAALKNGIVPALLVRPQLLGSHAAEYKHLGRLLDSSPECRLFRIRSAWRQPDSPERAADLEKGPWMELPLLRWIPGANRLAGEVLLSVAEQAWFRQYDKPLDRPCDDADAGRSPSK